MPRGSSPKRERQYEHIEDSARERGASPGRAKQIAARTVNKQRAESGETKGSSNSSKGKGGNGSGSGGRASGKASNSKASGGKASSSTSGSSSRGGGSRASSGSGSGTTFRQLYAEAQRRDIKGRSSMDKAQLERALAGSGSKR